MRSKGPSPLKAYSHADSDNKRLDQKWSEVDYVVTDHRSVQSYVDDVNPKTMEAISHEEQRLNQRYFHLLNQLERTKYQVMKLEEKLKQQNELETHPQVKLILIELNKVDKYKSTLIDKAQQLQEALLNNKQTIQDMRRSIYQKRLEIRDIVQESWKHQAEIVQLTKIKKDTKYFSMKSLRAPKMAQSLDAENAFITAQEQVESRKLNIQALPPLPLKFNRKAVVIQMMKIAKTPQQIQKVEEVISIYKQVHELRKTAYESRDEVNKISNRFNQIRNLLQECAQVSVKHFKNRQKITNSNGYANSIYFDVNSTKLKQPINGDSTLGRNDRNIKNILYDTFQHIMIDMIDSQQRNDSNGSTIADSIIRNSVSLEQFMQFSSDQILGLVVLQPRLLQEVIGVLDIKQKQVGLLGMKLKQLSNQFDQCS